MKAKKILAYILALALFGSVPAQGQLIPRGGGAGGGGGGGDASAANQTTQIGALPLEDTAHVTGDRGSFGLGVENSDLTAFTAGDKDYTPFGVTSLGQTIGIPMLSAEIATANQLGKAEGVLHVTGDAGVPALVIRNSATTPTAITGLDLRYSMIGVTSLTQVLTTQHHSTAYLTSIQVSKLEDTLHATGDAGIPAWGVRNEDATALTDAEDDYGAIALSRDGKVIGIPTFSTFLAATFQLGKREDAPHGSADVGVPTWGVTNESQSAFASGANDDYSPVATNQEGQQQMTLHLSGAYAQGAQVPKAEDAPAGNGDPGFISFGRRNDDHATSHIGADNDMGMFSLTEFGEIWVAHSGAAFFAITDTAIAAVSQNFAFGFTSKKVFITAPITNTDGVCIDHIGGTAVCPASDTAGDDVLEPGESISIDEHAVTSVSAISASGTQTVVVRAFN